jgi:hypothetical protein
MIVEAIIVIGLIWALIAIIRHFSKDRTPEHSRSTDYLRVGTESVTPKRDPTLYRPKTSVKSRTAEHIRFINGTTRGVLNDYDIKDLVDALTGAPLKPSLGLYQCRNCKVFYQTHSIEVINSENGGRCVSCLQTAIESVGAKPEGRGRNADVNIVTLENYKQHTGHVITFEGYVHTVLVSQRGVDYAVMFEAKRWTRGFKMVVFRGDVSRIGGSNFLFSLLKRRVRIRGLLINHKTFGYEIIISDPAMILAVE